MISGRMLSRSVTAVIAAAMLIGTSLFAQQATKPAEAPDETLSLVSQMAQKFHINRPTVDDELSIALLNGFLKDLDPLKLYFNQADVKDFDRFRTLLDDMVRGGNPDFARYVFQRYRDRVTSRMELAHELIDSEHDFTVEESIIIDGDELDWAGEEEVGDRWRKRIKMELLNARLDDEDDSETREKLHKKYRMVQRSIDQTDDTDVIEIFLTAMTQVFDPHSTYMSPNTLEDFQIDMKLSLDGIGAALRSDDGYTVVATIIKGGAADADGRLKVEDKIVAVGQTTDEMVDIVEMKLSEVVRLIRGERGTEVFLKVKPADGGESKVYKLIRQKIELEAQAVKGEIIESEEVDERIGRPAKIGVISIPSFYRDFEGAQGGGDEFKSAVRDVKAVLADFRAEGGIDGLIVDVRNNGGGSLSEAIEISGLFIADGPVVQVREPDRAPRKHYDEDPSVEYSGPLVVLTNRLSASASEIFAGVIKDYRRGVIIGDTTTHGKGTVQNVMPVAKRSIFNFAAPRGALKLTIQQFYRVNGDSTQNRGVESDIKLPSLLDHIDTGESFLDNALPFHQIRPASYDATPYINGPGLERLSERSRDRVGKSEDFAKVQKRISQYLEVKSRKEVSLNEDVRRTEIASEEAAKAEQEELETVLGEGEKEDEKEETVFPENFYNDEILEITVDYLTLLRNATTVQN